MAMKRLCSRHWYIYVSPRKSGEWCAVALKIGTLALMALVSLFGPATMGGRASGSPQVSPSTSGLTLNSQFLKGDPTAQSIAAGTSTYDISNTNYVLGQSTPANTLLFGYRIEMA